MGTPYEMAKEIVVSILRDKVGPDLTVELIRETVDNTAEFVGRSTGTGLTRSQTDELVRDLETVFNVWVGAPRILDNDVDHVPWLHIRREDIEWRFWNRYRGYMQSQWAAPAALASLEHLTDEVLSRIEDPDRSGVWDRRGLVVGHVQSGKTANYTGLVCKAVDSGYRLVVVLAGMHSNLRTQTQIRLEEGFLGYASYGDGAQQPIGAGLLDPGLPAGSVTHRGDKGDFSKSFAKQFNISPGQQPLLFVVKKNASILRNLVEWVGGFANAMDSTTGRRYVRDVPILVIDDEADQASVNTGKDDEQPKRINSLIRQLLNSFEQSAYVGYTATPFANIFIHEEASTDLEGPDLFPASFVISLPVPSNYIGPARVFGLDGDPELGIEPSTPLPLVRSADDGRDWLPERHKKTVVPAYAGRDSIPPSLREAMKAFILAGAAKAARGLGTDHHSMLIHVTRFVDVQDQIAAQVAGEMERLKRRIVYGDGDGPSIVQELRRLWETDFLPTTGRIAQLVGELDPFIEPLDWETVRTKLRETAEAIQVHTVHGRSVDSLQYELHKGKGLKVIAVGGNKLSRGLTLEGLTTSYFLRSSRMYDTLMQMGRWFGYRPKYIDLCRLYLPEDIEEWFGHITEASEELRREFEYMTLIGGTPRDYGLKVRSHPSLLVTSQVKMRAGTRLRLSFAGQVSETVVFRKDPPSIRHNLDAALRLLDALGEPDAQRGGSLVWMGVSASRITAFLNTYQTHPTAFRADSTLLAQYIERQQRNGELVEWSVCLATSTVPSARRAMLGTRTIGMIRREDSKTGALPNRLTIRRVLSPPDESLDLSAAEIKEARRLTGIYDRERGKESSDSKRVSGRAIREARSPKRGLLILYPLDPTRIGRDEGIQDKDTPVVGFAISFPGSKTAVAVDHVVNHVYYTEFYGDNEWSEDEDEDAS